MQGLLRKASVLIVSLGLGMSGAAQTSAKPAQKTLPWKSYCHPEAGFCLQYPAGWSVLGQVFDGNGVVFAPPQKQERELWDEVTAALVVPAPKGDESPVTIDQAITQAASGVREGGQSFQTMERRQRTVDNKPAELVKLRYSEQPSGREWIEELIFIEGPDSEIYSVALKCAPSSLARMEPLFLRMVDRWRLPEVAPASGATDERIPPAESATPKAVTPPKR